MSALTLANNAHGCDADSRAFIGLSEKTENIAVWDHVCDKPRNRVSCSVFRVRVVRTNLWVFRIRVLLLLPLRPVAPLFVLAGVPFILGN